MLLISCLLAAATLPQTLPPQPPASMSSSTLAQREKSLNAVFSDYWEQQLKDSPEFASTLGDKRYDDQLSDYSAAGYNTHLEHDRAFLDRLGAIDAAGLSAQEQLSKDLLVRKLVDEQEEARFKPWELPVNQFHGLHLELPQLVPQLSFDTADDYDHYVSRLGKVPTAFAQISDSMMTGMDDNRVPPKYLLEKALVQVNTLAQQKPEDSPFALPLKKFPASIPQTQQAEIRQQVLKAITMQVLPAYARFGRFLSAQYIPHGRTEPGIWSLSDGDAYYKFLVRESTTTDLTPDQIHKIGEDEVAKDEAQMLVIAKKLGFADLKSLRASIPNNPKLHPTSPEALIAVYRGYLDGMRPKLPQLFGRLPKAPLDVQAVPDYMAKNQAPAYYQHGTPDGKRPGMFFVNTYNYGQRPLTMAETVAYHEGLPGHHLQIAVAQELTGIPEFRKHNYYTAYTEGWGLYAEHLGKDVGFYTDPYSDYGRLEGDIWRAIRLVVDTGVHSEHWNRQQMVDYFHEHSSVDETAVQSEVDRYIAIPSQALGYKIGQLKFLELRARAQQALGTKFDIRGFHDTILDSGALPLDVVEQRVNAWIASQQGSKAQ
ncbi:MAG: hypothetical protein QOK38_2939 [Acidobacteriaceae bacterium]|jgi:uncharacterized protein (DUF885 family)|nr:hypothetical protein [Acidobacteriaceae bacterium]